MPALMAAVKAYATVGEMTQALVAVYGRYREPIRF
jgi:methylmalonyl-CoA mutase N-terminal domain/subunit